jgi:hypothetical protein
MPWLTWKAKFTDRCGRGISGVGGSTSFFSQRGKNRAIAGQLKALADDYQRRAKKLRMLTRPRHWLARVPAAERGAA